MFEIFSLLLKKVINSFDQVLFSLQVFFPHFLFLKNIHINYERKVPLYLILKRASEKSYKL